MNRKKLKKIAKIISNEVNVYPVKQSEEEYRSEYDSDVSDKLKKLVLNLIQYNENISINITDDRFVVSSNDINSIKNSSIPTRSMSDDNYLEILVSTEGFTLNLGYKKRSRYADNKIFNELMPLIKERLKEINSINFDEIWCDVMKKSGVIRDNNLDELGI
jgi:hypothetical protein